MDHAASNENECGVTMSSFVTQDEIDAMNASKLARETPFLICGVSQTYFSIARFYGEANFNGSHYTYLSDTDELIRDDVLKFVMKLRKPKKVKKAAATPESESGVLF